eukprot:Selendium_serpulae@DN4152_c0_g1_i1.p1
METRMFWGTVLKPGETQTWRITPSWALVLANACFVENKACSDWCTIHFKTTMLDMDSDEEGATEQVEQQKTPICRLSSSCPNIAMKNVEVSGDCRLEMTLETASQNNDIEVHLTGHVNEMVFIEDEDDEDSKDSDRPFLEHSTLGKESGQSAEPAKGKLFDCSNIKAPSLGSQLRDSSKDSAASKKDATATEVVKQKTKAEQPSDAAAASQKPRKEDLAAKGSPKVKQTLSNGVSYEIITIGNGPVAKAGKRIRVRYEGRLAKNGAKFDKGQIEFTVKGGEMIAGFDAGVVGMLLKETRRIFVPSKLGYGMKANGKIPAGSDLIFTVTLMSVKNF